MKKTQIPAKLLCKFLIASLIGLVAFVVPIHSQGGVNTVVGILTSAIKNILMPIMDELVLLVVLISALCSIADAGLERLGRTPPAWFHSVFHTTPVYLITKIVASGFMICCYTGVGPAFLTDPAVGGTMVDLSKTLIALALALSYLLPFLTEAGLMEFVGEITRPFVRPLFRVPSDASLDLIASWMGAANAAVILSAQKYYKGYYTKREAAIVMCNFSLVSIPFCMVVAETAGVSQYFPAMYGLLFLLGVFLAVVTPRIYPLNRLHDDYYAKLPVNSEAEQEKGLFRRALMKSCSAAENFHVRSVTNSGNQVLTTVLFNLVSTVIAWGILGMIVVEYTPIFQWLSYPVGVLLDLMGVEYAYAAAPATLVGFVDMFIPALLVTGIASVRTRFIIATLSLIQIIYITEVGAVVIQTNLGIDLKRLLFVFLERTFLSLPIIVLASLLIV